MEAPGLVGNLVAGALRQRSTQGTPGGQVADRAGNRREAVRNGEVISVPATAMHAAIVEGLRMRLGFAENT